MSIFRKKQIKNENIVKKKELRERYDIFFFEKGAKYIHVFDNGDNWKVGYTIESEISVEAIVPRIPGVTESPEQIKKYILENEIF